MKKITTLLLALCMLLSLTACGGESESNIGDAAGSGAASSEMGDASQSSEPEQKPSAPQKELTFTETVVVDNENCAITLTNQKLDNIWGYTLTVQLENKSADQTYMFSVDSASINGVQTDPFFATEVAPGKKANKEITFYNEHLEENNITEYTDIELSFRAYDSNDWSADDVAYETVHVYPYGEENATLFTREAQPTDQVLVDNDAVTIIATGYEKDDITGYTVDLFLVNKIDKDMLVGIEDASVNGFMADPFYAASVRAGKCAFGSVTWANSTLEENGISEVENLEFTIRAFNENDWSEDDFVNELITLNP